MKRGPISDSYWAVDGQLLAGEYPGDLQDQEAREKVARLLDAGVRLFVDLTESGELLPYAALLEALAGERGLDVRHVRHPIRDASIPGSPAEMTAILDLLDDARASNTLAYVHCWGGTGRTGTVVGCYYRRQGMSADPALARVLAGWRTMAKAPEREAWGMTSPETSAQADYVLRWEQGEDPKRA